MRSKTLMELSPRERQVMDALYRLGRGTVAEILDGMESPPSYSAIRAVFRVLEEKGQVVHLQDGPRYVYRPAVQTERARRRELRHLVRTFFDGQPEAAALALLRMSDVEISAEEMDRLAARVEDARREGR